MTVISKRVSITSATPAQQIYRVGARAIHVIVKNLGSVPVDIGGSGTTTGAGYQLDAGAVIGPFQLSGGDVLYGVASSGTQAVQVLTTGN